MKTGKRESNLEEMQCPVIHQRHHQTHCYAKFNTTVSCSVAHNQLIELLKLHKIRVLKSHMVTLDVQNELGFFYYYYSSLEHLKHSLLTIT